MATTAASYVLSFDSTSVTFSALVSMSGVTTPPTGSGSPPPAPHGPPTVVLSRPHDSNIDLAKWQTLVRLDEPSSRRECTLRFLDATGQTLQAYTLYNALFSATQVVGGTETDTFVCDQIVPD